jgi:hypothetical protein
MIGGLQQEFTREQVDNYVLSQPNFNEDSQLMGDYSQNMGSFDGFVRRRDRHQVRGAAAHPSVKRGKQKSKSKVKSSKGDSSSNSRMSGTIS